MSCPNVKGLEWVCLVGPGGAWWDLVGSGMAWWGLVGPGRAWWGLLGPGGKAKAWLCAVDDDTEERLTLYSENSEKKKLVCQDSRQDTGNWSL